MSNLVLCRPTHEELPHCVLQQTPRDVHRSAVLLLKFGEPVSFVNMPLETSLKL
jgi:hypothetical protein